MTGTCKLCRVLIMSAPVSDVGPGRAQAEFLAFAEEMRRHMHSDHKDYVQVFAALLLMAAQYFSSLFAELPPGPDAAEQQANMRDFVCAQIQGGKVVIELSRPEGAAGAVGGQSSA